MKKPVSRSYPKIIGFWTSSGRILPKLCQSDVKTHVYWCLKYDTLWWLIWGHITKCYKSACWWLNQCLTPPYDRNWTQLLLKVILHLSDNPFMFLNRVILHLTISSVISSGRGHMVQVHRGQNDRFGNFFEGVIRDTGDFGKSFWGVIRDIFSES